MARINPLKLDPTRTLSLRRAFYREIVRALVQFRRSLLEFLVTKDAFGLQERKSFIQLSATTPRQYEFLTSADKLEAFRQWFQQQVEADILSPDPNTPLGQPWTTEYVESAYKRGQLNAFFASKRGIPGLMDWTQEEFLRNSFLAPETMAKILLLGTRAWNEMKGLTDVMGQQLNRILAQGIADGTGVERIARQMTAVISGLSRSRALMIARTEIIHAHAEGQLDAFDKLGVQELGVSAEWSTAGDDRVCPRCHRYEGQVFSIQAARGMIPLHPNCRCSWKPYLAKAIARLRT